MRGAGDGTVTDASGFGEGTFSHSIDGRRRAAGRRYLRLAERGIAGAFLTGKGNFQ